MQPITVYLAKFKDIGLAHRLVIDEVVKTLTKLTGAQFERDSVSVKNNTIYIQTTPLIKNEIFIKKEKIMSALTKALRGITTVKDIL